MGTVDMLNILLIVIIAIVLLLGFIAIFVVYSMRKPKKKDDAIQQANDKNRKQPNITRNGVGINSIYQFMEFDSITNNMIVRKNRRQYVMVIDCKGINYDLLSEVEKEAVEVGFTEMLNTLRFPVQLYIQTRTFDLSDILDDYRRRIGDIEDQIIRINSQIEQAKNRGDTPTVERLLFEKKRRENIYEYGQSIEDYTQKITEGANILQQKTYLICSYYTAEYGDISKFSKDEIDDIAFSELYTRAQTIIRALTSAEVTGKVLSSEELAELLYVAYNREQSDDYSLKTALNAEYDRLYSTARDVLEDRKLRIEQEIENRAVDLASKSILKADEINREKRAAKIKARAKEMVEEYKSELSNSLYEETKKQIDSTILEEEKESAKKKEEAAAQAAKPKTVVRRVVRTNTAGQVNPQAVGRGIVNNQ